jgi:glycosyltransferase involved in cell wall biosynthesis
MTVEATIVIATYRRPKLLSRCLEALINQSFPCDKYEVLVVTDGADEKTSHTVARVTEQYHACPSIRCISLDKKRGPAAARNVGWKQAKGKMILFTDDDCVPLFYWIESFVRAWQYHNKTEIAFSGKIKVPLPPDPTDYEKNTAVLEQASFVTANCACTKAALEKVEGLDEDFTMAWREDSALEFDLVENNIPIVKVDGAIVVHPVRDAPWGISIKEQKKSMFNPLLYKKHPTLYQQRIHKRPPWCYYGIIFFCFTTLTAALLHREVLMRISLIAWITLIAWFTAKRLEGASLTFRHVAEMIVTSFVIPFLSVYWTVYGAFHYKTFFLWHSHKPNNLKSLS